MQKTGAKGVGPEARQLEGAKGMRALICWISLTLLFAADPIRRIPTLGAPAAYAGCVICCHTHCMSAPASLARLLASSRPFLSHSMAVMVPSLRRACSAGQAMSAFSTCRVLRSQYRSAARIGVGQAGSPASLRRPRRAVPPCSAAAAASTAAAEPQAEAATSTGLASSTGTAAEAGTSSSSGSGRIELPKNFDPAASEERLYQWWEASGFFRPDPAAPGRSPAGTCVAGTEQLEQLCSGAGFGLL